MLVLLFDYGFTLQRDPPLSYLRKPHRVNQIGAQNTSSLQFMVDRQVCVREVITVAQVQVLFQLAFQRWQHKVLEKRYMQGLVFREVWLLRTHLQLKVDKCLDCWLQHIVVPRQTLHETILLTHWAKFFPHSCPRSHFRLLD